MDRSRARDCTGSLASESASLARICSVMSSAVPGQFLRGRVMRHALEQFLLGTEVVHDQTAVNAGCARDLPDGGPLIAALDEQACGRGQDPGLGPASLVGPGRGWFRFVHAIDSTSVDQAGGLVLHSFNQQALNGVGTHEPR